MHKILRPLLACLFVVGCAGMNKGCAQVGNGITGSDWVVVQFDMSGRPFNCWKLQGAVVQSAEAGDGIDWQDTRTGHLLHIGGWYNRIQVSGGDFDSAAHQLGLDMSQCETGHYPAHATATVSPH